MLQSMTGYGRADEVRNGRRIVVELRSVNARYFEYNSHLPRRYLFMDDELRKLVTSRVKRGKVELTLTLQSVSKADTEVHVDYMLAEAYVAALRELRYKFGLADDSTVGLLAQLPDVLVETPAPTDEESLLTDVKQTAGKALDAFVAMRMAEGEKLRLDLLDHLTAAEDLLNKIEEATQGRVQAYYERLYSRLRELLEDHTIEESRLVTEAALFADKTAIDEETVRLRSHIVQFRSFLKSEEPVGRRLDFLTQELNREANTIGSKCQDVTITRWVVDLKSEIEKIREQLQNLE